MADSNHNGEVLQKCQKCRKKYPASSYPYKIGSTERAKACRDCGTKDREQACEQHARNKEKEPLDIPKTSTEATAVCNRDATDLAPPVETTLRQLLFKLTALTKSCDALHGAYIVALPESMVWDNKIDDGDEGGLQLQVLHSK